VWILSDYSDFIPGQRLWTSLSVSADGTMVAYVSDISGQFNVWVQPSGRGPARQLTFFVNRAARQVAWAPDGTLVAFNADSGGDEQYQIYLVPAAGGEPVRVSSGTGRHTLAEASVFDRTGRYLLFSGANPDTGALDIIVHDNSTGTQSRFPGATGGPCFPIEIAPDGRHILAGTMGSNTECRCYLADLSRPGTALEPVTTGMPGEYYYPGPWADGGTGFYVQTTDANREHVGLARYSLDDHSLAAIDDPGWDVEDIVVSADRRTLVWSVNQDGYSTLRARHADKDKEIALPALPGGRIRAMSISADGNVLALLLDTPDRPAEVVIAILDGSRPVRYLTDTRPPALHVTEPVIPELIRYPAKDGAGIPAFVYRPPGPGPHPVLMSVHGGPESQARPEYSPLHQCLLASGIAILTPNIRGSSGYGRAWQTRIYHDWGGIDLTDLAAAHAWLTAQPWADPDRIAIYGMSYGGFASLSCITRLPRLWAAGVSVCGMSDLVTLARSMPPHWIGTVTAMFGDFNDPDQASDLKRRSPLSYAGQITAPLLVVQGANDPRVPKTEADQIVDSARANGAAVSYLVFGDEGHGFTSRANNIKAHTAIAEFLIEHLSAH
jgi:dipeptidyl aminopeptidase/acylaminoacyl peptidase